MLIDIENLSFSYPDGLEEVFSGLNLKIDGGWKLGVVGANGRGKTTFLKLLSGEEKGKGRITADTSFVRFPCNVSDESKTAYELFYEIAPEGELWRLLKECGLLSLDEEILYRPFNTLSGGEKTKFFLAAVFSQEAFPLIDEPTDHLDLNGRKRLAEYLNRKSGFIVVSHDRDFLDGCCNHILAFEKNGNVSFARRVFCVRCGAGKAQGGGGCRKRKAGKRAGASAPFGGACGRLGRKR